MNSDIILNKSRYGSLKFEFRGLSSFMSQIKKEIIQSIAAIIIIISGLALKMNPGGLPNSGITRWQTPDFDMVIQVGAFRKEMNATVFRDKLSALIDKPVIMVEEEGYYKVQLTGFKNLEEIEKIIPALGLIGIKDFWVPPVKKEAEALNPPIIQPDTTQKPPEEKSGIPVVENIPDVPVIEENPVAPEITTFALEIGAFRKKNRAINAQRKVISRLKLPVEIVTQWNRYHVLITGFLDKTEINKYYPELARMGYREISVIKNYKKQQ
jgi:cell division protein FtsN